MRLAALLALVATCGPTAPAVAADPPPAAAPKPELVCRERRAPDVAAPACTGSRGVVQPCSGVLVSPADLLACARAESDLVECRGLADIAARECAALRASDMKGCTDREASVVAERDAARALAAAHAAELERLRGTVAPEAERWTWPRILGVAGAVVVAAVAGWRCADEGGPEACFMAGVAGGAGGVLVVF